MPKTPTKNSKAGDAAIAAGETGGQPVPALGSPPTPAEVDTSEMGRKEKAAAKAALDDATPRLYVVTITDQVKPQRSDEVTLREPSGWPHVYRRGLVGPDATAEQKDAAKKRRILTHDVRLTPVTARGVARRGWIVAEKAQE